jgi:hypothetical protein
MEGVIYTDGHGTKVTTQEFITGNTTYLIRGIMEARMNQIRTSAIPSITLLVLGIIAFIAGFFRLLNHEEVVQFRIGEMDMTLNRIATLVGFIFIILGLIGLALRHKKYSVHIRTAEGEKDPVVSIKKDYVAQIVSAINAAVRERRQPEMEIR